MCWLQKKEMQRVLAKTKEEEEEEPLFTPATVSSVGLTVSTVSPPPGPNSGPSCPWDWPVPSPTTAAAQVSCRVSKPADEGVDP